MRCWRLGVQDTGLGGLISVILLRAIPRCDSFYLLLLLLDDYSSLSLSPCFSKFSVFFTTDLLLLLRYLAKESTSVALGYADVGMIALLDITRCKDCN
ncbi:uncharacterized protein BDZ99DRAFT_284937 [Mytilinidion resinicola]|uniref:Uncharacterized protein n=1 Tax=Mytilinidion resinicola TaxID=574789 RepID=A0A6A6YT52_9PEZI|nr:uncharacterized protein BDZ99DRAFT_284937 [Mytilinidion resinicola]KAF2811990.1 hypothetical protein BDZ99DRAFT_284937 [Mytilinidion resinicola]